MVEIVIVDTSEERARAASDVAVAEIERLENTFSMYRPDSELSRWKVDELDDPSDEFCAVMAGALHWQSNSEGRFNPLAGRFSRVWADAESNGAIPTDDELAIIADAIFEPRYAIDDGIPKRTRDCTDLNLNALAKGFIVDAAATLAAATSSPVGVLVSAGGDMRQLGAQPTAIGIENPLRRYDNEPPVATVSLHNAGLATSGGAHRGFRIAGHSYSHALDARTGQPIDQQASISVVAPDAMTADAIATNAHALAPRDAVAMVEAMPEAACLVIDSDGAVHTDRTWEQLAVS